MIERSPESLRDVLEDPDAVESTVFDEDVSRRVSRADASRAVESRHVARFVRLGVERDLERPGVGRDAAARAGLGPQTPLFLIVGMLCGFTTFSTFSYESVTRLAQREELRALAYVSLHLLLGIGFAWLGYRLTSIT